MLSRQPAELSREDLQMIAMWMLERLDGDEIELAAEMNGINVDGDGRDAPEIELSSQIKDAGEEDLPGLLRLFALCPSALRDEALADSDSLVLADRRYPAKTVKTKRSSPSKLKVVGNSKRRVS